MEQKDFEARYRYIEQKQHRKIMFRKTDSTIKSKINIKYTRRNSTINSTLEIWYIRPNIFPCIVSRTIFLHLRRRKSCSLNVTCSALKAYARECRGRCFLRGRWSGSAFFLSTIELMRDTFDHVSGNRMPLFSRSPVQGLTRYTGVLFAGFGTGTIREIGSRNRNIVLIDGPVTNSGQWWI